MSARRGRSPIGSNGSGRSTQPRTGGLLARVEHHRREHLVHLARVQQRAAVEHQVLPREVDERSDSRNAISSAVSSAVPTRSSGVPSSIEARAAGSPASTSLSGVCMAGRHAVHRMSGASPTRGGLRQRDHRGLGGRVRRLAARARTPDTLATLTIVPATAAQQRRRRPDAVEGAVHVDLEDQVELAVRVRLEGLEVADAGVVDQPAQPTELVGRSPQLGVEGLAVRHVGDERGRRRSRRRAPSRRHRCGRAHRRTPSGGEVPADRRADAGRAAGDDDAAGAG